MTTTPHPLNYGGFPHRPPSHQNSPPIRNNSGRNSASRRRLSIGSILSNEMDRNKSPSGALSPVYTLNEDPPMSTSRVPLYPSVNGPSTMDENFCDYNGFNSHMGSDVPAASRPSGYFGPSPPFPTALPVRPAQPDSSASDTALVSFYCHACELFIQGRGADTFEILSQHRCTRPTDDGYTYPSKISPPNRSYDKRGRSYAEEYSQFNPTRAGSGMGSSYPAANHGNGSGFDPSPLTSSSTFGSPTSYSHNTNRRRLTISDLLPDQQRVFEPPSDAGVTSNPYAEVSGPSGWDDSGW